MGVVATARGTGLPLRENGILEKVVVIVGVGRTERRTKGEVIGHHLRVVVDSEERQGGILRSGGPMPGMIDALHLKKCGGEGNKAGGGDWNESN